MPIVLGCFAMDAIGQYSDDDVGSTCKQRDYKDATDLVCSAVDCQNATESEVNGTLQAKENDGAMHEQQDALCFQNTGQGWWNESEIGVTIRTPAGGDSMKANLVAAVDCRNGAENADVNGTLQSKPNGGTSYNLQNVVRERYIVRRLTPLECTRLQGYPDGWVDIGDWIDSKGKKHKDADSPKYKALGNSIAIPPWLWVLSRLNEYCEEKTMASLFDGIGGFPLIWEFLNGTGSAVWCSEIEEFPIAVTKIRFPDGKEVTP